MTLSRVAIAITIDPTIDMIQPTTIANHTTAEKGEVEGVNFICNGLKPTKQVKDCWRFFSKNGGKICIYNRKLTIIWDIIAPKYNFKFFYISLSIQGVKSN